MTRKKSVRTRPVNRDELEMLRSTYEHMLPVWQGPLSVAALAETSGLSKTKIGLLQAKIACGELQRAEVTGAHHIGADLFPMPGDPKAPPSGADAGHETSCQT